MNREERSHFEHLAALAVRKAEEELRAATASAEKAEVELDHARMLQAVREDEFKKLLGLDALFALRKGKAKP